MRPFTHLAAFICVILMTMITSCASVSVARQNAEEQEAVALGGQCGGPDFGPSPCQQPTEEGAIPIHCVTNLSDSSGIATCRPCANLPTFNCFTTPCIPFCEDDVQGSGYK
ncbi:hypothetical protein FA15DRAFT_674082 [Coprinopsis marcescibilis]|uniref:Uncharacterized protein n=1 Tax=Coprinopsis marcescibilis TaxID=230819 RepID=A0A5C3KIA0_COPMA|nr:hypothetical protein FA15DRAFT_674082 [Coprinopsis marcescibilis]